METTSYVLVMLVVLLPLVSAIVVPLFKNGARRMALWTAILHLLITIALVTLGWGALDESANKTHHVQDRGLIKFQPRFVPGDLTNKLTAPYRTNFTLLSLAESPATKPGPRIQFYIGIDGLNLWLVALASVMMIPAILISWDAIQERQGAFYGWMLMLQGSAIGAFVSFDVILFYIFFELTLVPSFFLIGGWGSGSGRRDAARKFFLYTFAGSMLSLIGIIGIVLTNPNLDGSITFSLPDLMGNVQEKLNQAQRDAKAGNPDSLNDVLRTQSWLFCALIAGFMVKVPVWPFHTWLPSAYGESPVGVTVLLSSLLAKLGTFGILRFVLTLTPDAALAYGLPVIGWLAAFGIVYAAFCAYNQKDIKLTIAYSSVSHLGFLVLGLFTLNNEGLSGSVLHMVNHGLSTGALFALLAFLLDRYRTTQLNQFGGLMGRFPNFAFFSFIFCLASIGLPGLNNFVSEMLMLAGLYNARNPGLHSLGLAVVAAFSILLSACYMLTMMQHVYFNPLKEPQPVIPEPGDITRREFVVFGSLTALCLVLGLAPQLVLDPMKAEIDQLTVIGNEARERAGVPPEPVAPIAPPQPKGMNKGGGKDKGGKGGGGKDKGGKGGKGGGGKDKGIEKAMPKGKMLDEE